MGLAQAGRSAQAIPLLREVIAANPGNLLALETLGGCLLDEQRHEQVIDLLAPLVAADQLDRFASYTCLASAYEARGQISEALDAYRAALGLRPSEAGLVRAIERLSAALHAQDK